MIPYFLRSVLIARLSPLEAFKTRAFRMLLGDDEVLNVEFAAIDALIGFNQLQKAR